MLGGSYPLSEEPQLHDQPNGIDPRSALTHWANQSDEWVRRIVRLVLESNGDFPTSEQSLIYQLLLEEKGFETRSLPKEPAAVVSPVAVGPPEPLRLTHISNIKGVNALVDTARIDFAPGLTLLFGENATGKTGYARILKYLAGSRSADEILPDVNQEEGPSHPSAEIGYRIGEVDSTCEWKGEPAQFPFTSISVFDTPSVHFHTDAAVGYTYRPSSLALFDAVTSAVKYVANCVTNELSTLQVNSSSILSRFDARSSIYPYIQSLGALTNLPELRSLGTLPENALEKKAELEQSLALLSAGMIGQQIVLLEGLQRALSEAIVYTTTAQRLDVQEYNLTLAQLSELTSNQTTLRDSLFAAAALPAPPEQTWEAFVRSGLDYRRHLESVDAHDASRCLYCRQSLSQDAAQLIARYSDYLESQIAADIHQQELVLKDLVEPLQENSLGSVKAYLTNLGDNNNSGSPARPEQVKDLRSITDLDQGLQRDLKDRVLLTESLLAKLASIEAALKPWLAEVNDQLEKVRTQDSEREASIEQQQAALVDLKDRFEVNQSWVAIEKLVAAAQRAHGLREARTGITTVLTKVTNLSTSASQHLTNKNFQQLFTTECKELRAPELKLEFFGREGRAQRRRTLPSKDTPSKVLSEGEQKVLALADFIAETRLSDQSVPVIFDDPVSSLDHRRVNEVASRIADLASTHQIVVFTHDIFFTTCLLTLLEGSARCSYYRVTDDDGKGTVTHSTGPRWDTISYLTSQIHASIEKARNATGEERNHYIREGYGWLRSWCEVFVEHDVLAQVTERYQPNVRMTSLSNIRVSKLEKTIAIVLPVFADACRYIEGHSQPLPTLGVAPAITQLESDWEKVRQCRAEYNKPKS